MGHLCLTRQQSIKATPAQLHALAAPAARAASFKSSPHPVCATWTCNGQIVEAPSASRDGKIGVAYRVGERLTEITHGHCGDLRRARMAWQVGFHRQTSVNREHRLNTIKLFAVIQNENSVSCIARTRSSRTLCSLLSIDRRLPKLDVVARLVARKPNPTSDFRRPISH